MFLYWNLFLEKVAQQLDRDIDDKFTHIFRNVTRVRLIKIFPGHKMSLLKL